MSDYLAPGVYVGDVEGNVPPIQPVDTGTTGMLGRTERGPIEPSIVTSVAEYRRRYGGVHEQSHLAMAVDGFFRNGGSRCVVGRITAETETATASIEDESGETVIDVAAVGPGKWGANVAVFIADGSMADETNERFELIVRYWADDETYEDAIAGYDAFETAIEDAEREDTVVVDDFDVPDPDVEEVYDGLSPETGSSTFDESLVNDRSAVIECTRVAAGRPVNTDGVPIWLAGSFSPAEPTLEDFLGDRSNPPAQRTGLAGLETVDEISTVCVPDENDVDGLTPALVAHCEDLGDRFAILQAPEHVDDVGELYPPVAAADAAFYVPWLEVSHPETGSIETVPPGGHIAGIYARSDADHGVHTAPANEVVRGVRGLQRDISNSEQAILNPRGVNCIRSFRGRGIRVWGVRTTSNHEQWTYVNVRRLYRVINQSIEEGTGWVAFEPNNESLWARVERSIADFLEDVWSDGALMGTNPDEAFYVRCDRTTMTQRDVDGGRLVCEVGIAPTRPAEFIVFRIEMWTASAN